MSVEEWGDLAEDEEGELVDGVLVEEEIPDVVHEAVIMWLASLLREYFRAREGFVFASGIKLVVRPRSGRMADVVAFTKDALPRKGKLVRTPPYIAIEVISSSPNDVRRDRLQKTSDYAAFGVRYCWLLDPRARTLEIFELGADRRYVLAATASNRLEAVPGCEGLVVELDALWAEIDQIPDEE